MGATPSSVDIVSRILCLVINIALIEAIRPEMKLGAGEQFLYVTDEWIHSIL